jgi:hypothetical protein
VRLGNADGVGLADATYSRKWIRIADKRRAIRGAQCAIAAGMQTGGMPAWRVLPNMPALSERRIAQIHPPLLRQHVH